MARRLEVEIVGDASSLKRALSAADSSSKSLGSRFGSLAKGAGLVAGAAGLGGLIATLKVGIGEFAEASKVGAQTNAVLKSTGGAAGVTKKEIEGLAGSILRKTGIDDEAIQSGENLLLTFTNIRNEAGAGNDIFNQTTGIMADLSTAMGIDTKSAALQLGKALNDPAKGMTKLQRIGVTFTDGQKAAAEAMVKSGDVAGAQKIILGELTKEFGGSAEAAGKTLPGQLNILKETFSNLAGEIVGKMVPAVQLVVGWITKHWGEIEAVIGGVFDGIGWAFTNVLKPVFVGIVDGAKAVVSWFERNWSRISDVFVEVFGPLKKVGESFIGFFDDLFHGRWGKLWGDFRATLSGAFGSIGSILGHALDGLHNLLDRLLDATGLSGLESALDDVFAGTKRIWTGIADVWAGIVAGDWPKVGKAVGRILAGIGEQFYGLVKLLPQIAEKALGAVLGIYTDLGAKILDGLHLGFLTDGFKMYFGGLKDTLTGLFKVIHGLLTLDLGEVLDGLGKMLKGAAKQIAAPFVAAYGAVKAAGKKIGELLYDWILEPLADLGRALAGALEDGIRALGRAVASAAHAVAGFGERIAGWLKDAFVDALEFGAWVLGRIRDAAITGASTVANWAERIVGWIRVPFERLADFGGWVLGKLRDAVISGAQTVAGWAERIVGWLKEGFLRVVDFAGWVLTEIGSAVISGAQTVAGWASSIAGWVRDAFLEAVKFGAWVLERIEAAAITGASTVAGWATRIGEWLKAGFLDFLHFGAWVLERIGDAVISGAQTVGGWADKIGGWLKQGFLDFLHFGAWILDKIGDATISGAQTVGGWADKIGGWLKQGFLDFLHFGAWIASKIEDAVISGKNTIGSWADTLGGWFETAFKGVLHFGAWVADKIEAGYNAVKNALGNLKDRIVGWLRSLFDWFSPVGIFEDLGHDMMRGLGKGIKGHLKHPLEMLKLMFRLVGKAFPADWQDWLSNLAGAGVGLVKHGVEFATSGIPSSDFVEASLPPDAHENVKNVIREAFAIGDQNWPYAVGGGRPGPGPSLGSNSWSNYPGPPYRVGYDCSGAVSTILRAGGFMDHTESSGYYQSWGLPGYGKAVSTLAIGGSGGSGHVFAVLGLAGREGSAGAGWGTGANATGGPGWYEHSRGGYIVRHPFGTAGAGGGTGSGSAQAFGFTPSDGPDIASGNYLGPVDPASLELDTGDFDLSDFDLPGTSLAGLDLGAGANGSSTAFEDTGPAGSSSSLDLAELAGLDTGSSSSSPFAAIASSPEAAAFAAPAPGWHFDTPTKDLKKLYATVVTMLGHDPTRADIPDLLKMFSVQDLIGAGFASSLFDSFAAGTNFAPGGWSVVGEQGPELRYVPRGSRIVPSSRLGASSSAAPIMLEARLPVYLDGRQITEAVHRGLLAKQRENGSLGLEA